MKLFNSLAMSLLCSLLALSQISARGHINWENEKIYFSKETVEIIDGMIAIHTEEGIAFTKTLFTDADGVFVFTKDVEFLVAKELVECRRKHLYNRWMDRFGGCPFCKREDREDKKK